MAKRILRQRLLLHSALCLLLLLHHTAAFLTPTTTARTATALNVWWFGGSQAEETFQQDSCELVAVRIERTSSNSRRIFGEIVIPDVPASHVWTILTDYDRLAVHVPNLVDSRVVSRPPRGQQGDGSYECRLFQKGAQKIVGFEFGASVTMDMKEKIVVSNQGREERRITFQCADSFFFSEFDGVWTVYEQRGVGDAIESVLSYVVDVRPKGPVPVQALEWRIREDVPTNLRAVKRAAMQVGAQRVGGEQHPPRLSSMSRLARAVQMNVKWDADETMAAYLKE